MAKIRVVIDDALAASVMFDSDRTCCVCRTSKQVQIHHIDGNPANNSRDNLAVICLSCHSDAHSKPAFVRGLSAEVIRLYDRTWQEIVAARLRLAESHSLEASATLTKRELTQEVMLDVQIAMMDLNNNLSDAEREASEESGNVWAKIAGRVPTLNHADFTAWHQQFRSAVSKTIDKIDRIEHLYGDVIPAEVRVKIVRLKRNAVGVTDSYDYVPSMCENGLLSCKEAAEHADSIINSCRSQFETCQQEVLAIADAMANGLADNFDNEDIDADWGDRE